MQLSVVDADDRYLRYVSLCTHIDSDDQVRDEAAEMRLRWLKDQLREGGMSVKVAVDEKGDPLGFVHLIPIELPASGMVGKDLMVIPCLTLGYQQVYAQRRGSGVGRVLLEASEQEAKRRGFKGLAVHAYDGDFWFMPSGFFRRMGFRRVSEDSEIWVRKWGEAADPSLRPARYEYVPIPGKVVIDYFWSPFCLTVCQELLNVRSASEEFGGKVVLREHRADDPEVAKRYGLSRALFIDGERKDWGYAAPRDELRKVIRSRLPQTG